MRRRKRSQGGEGIQVKSDIETGERKRSVRRQTGRIDREGEE